MMAKIQKDKMWQFKLKTIQYIQMKMIHIGIFIMRVGLQFLLHIKSGVAKIHISFLMLMVCSILAAILHQIHRTSRLIPVASLPSFVLCSSPDIKFFMKI